MTYCLTTYRLCPPLQVLELLLGGLNPHCPLEFSDLSLKPRLITNYLAYLGILSQATVWRGVYAWKIRILLLLLCIIPEQLIYARMEGQWSQDIKSH